MDYPMRAAVIGGGLVLLPFGPALARDTSTPDWPCVQRKIATLTSTQVWDGPAVEGITKWNDVPEVSGLVRTLANRRTPMGQAEAALSEFAHSQPDADRAERLTLVFAGVFETLHSQRKAVIEGLEKYLKAQRERAVELERQGVEIAGLKERAASDEKAASDLQEARTRFDWAQRIFQERQNSLPFACEVPVRIDQRIFTLGKSIAALLKN
jgi:hypothetical protein